MHIKHLVYTQVIQVLSNKKELKEGAVIWNLLSLEMLKKHTKMV